MPIDDSQLTLAQTEVHYLHSTAVNDEYKLFVAHPQFPVPAGQPIPVVYALDANASFGTVVDAARMLQLGREMPACYVVGIGYRMGGLFDTLGVRSRDYTPTRFRRFEEAYPRIAGWPGTLTTGGADNFLRFIREELKPWVAATLPGADSADATLTGASFGGLFATYALLQAPDTFQRYVACSPSLLYDDRVMLQLEGRCAATRSDLDARVFYACGGLENEADMLKALDVLPPAMRDLHVSLWRPQMLELMQPFVQTLARRNYPGLRLSSHVFEGENHMSVYPAAVCRGLREVFKA